MSLAQTNCGRIVAVLRYTTCLYTREGATRNIVLAIILSTYLQQLQYPLFCQFHSFFVSSGKDKPRCILQLNSPSIRQQTFRFKQGQPRPTSAASSSTCATQDFIFPLPPRFATRSSSLAFLSGFSACCRVSVELGCPPRFFHHPGYWR